MAERIESERWEQEAISDLAGLAMGDRGSRMAAAAEEEVEEEELASVEEIEDTSSAEIKEGGRSRPRARAGGARRKKTRIPSSSPETSPKSETESSSDDDSDRPRIVPLYRARHAVKAKDAAAHATAATTTRAAGAADAPKSSRMRAAATAAVAARVDSPSKAPGTAQQQQGVGDSLAGLALQAQGVAAVPEPAAGNYLVAHPGAMVASVASVASHKRARRPNGSEDRQEPTKRARKHPDAFVAEPASGKIRQDDAAKNQSAAQTNQHAAKPRQQLRATDESTAMLAVLKDQYIQIVGRPACGRFARDPGWLRDKIAEKKKELAEAKIAAKPAEPKEKREMRDWLFARQLGSIADKLINEGFETLKDLIEGELTQKEVEDECFKFNMYTRKRLLRELEYETKSRSVAVAVGSPPISRPEEHAETVANGTAVPAGTALSEAEKDEEPDAEDMPLSDDDGSSDEDDDRNIYDPAESIASHTYRPNNKKCSRSPGQSRIRPPAASSTKGNQPILKDDTDEKNVHDPAKQISSPTQSSRLKDEKKRTRSPEEYTSRRPALSPTMTEKQPRRKLPPLTLRKIVPAGLERPTPATWEQVASTDLFSAFWELSVHDLDPELPSTPRGQKRVSLRKDNLIASFSAKSMDWVPDTSSQRFVKMFLDHCIFPRARHSKVAKDDARYCCEFVSKMHQVKTPRFNLVLYMDTLVKNFPRVIKNSDGCEEQMLNLIELLCETLRRVSRWRTCAAAFLQECCSPTCDTTHEKFLELSSEWHSQLATVLIKELAPTSTKQQKHAPKRCYMIALQILLRWLTLTPQEHEMLNKYLQHLEKTGSGTSITLAIKLRQQLPPPQNFGKKLVAAESRHQGAETPNHHKPASEPHSTLASRLVSFYIKEYPDQKCVAVDEFLAALYRQDPRAKSEMDALRGSYPQPARFLAEACGGEFEVTNHDLQYRVGLAQARVTKPIDTALHRRLITAFWWSFGTQETSSQAFFAALNRHDPAARKLLPSKPMVYLMQHCCNVFHVQDCGSGHYKLRLRSEAIEDNRMLCNPNDECIRNREAPPVQSEPKSARSKQPAAAPSAGVSIRALKVEPEDMRIGAAAAKQMSQVDRQKAIDALVAKHKAAKKSAIGQLSKASTTGAAPTKKISGAASPKSTVAKPKAAKKIETIVDLTAMADDIENVSESLRTSATASPIPDGALVGTASIEQDENRISGMAERNDEGARMAVTSHNDVTRDPRRRESTVTGPVQDRHRQHPQQPGLTQHMHSQPLQRPPSQPQPQQEQLLLGLGPKPDTPAFRLFLYKRQEKPHELSWICFEQGMHGRNSFPVPPDLVAHIEQVIRIAAVKELQTLPSRRIWSSGPRGGREWPKMRSKLLSSADSTQPNKVVVCSPRLADRLFHTDTATRYKGHYYLSGDRLYYDESGRLKAQYFK